jgi:hypothetical protein
MYTAPPIVSYGMLEDLLEEIRRDRDEGKTLQGLRVTTDFRTKSGGGIIGEVTTVSLVVTSCTTEAHGQTTFMQYGLWSWRIASYAELHGNKTSPWTLEEANLLADTAIEAVMQAIERATGILAKKGMYCIPDSEWLTVRGGTHLVDLKQLREGVRPREEEGSPL